MSGGRDSIAVGISYSTITSNTTPNSGKSKGSNVKNISQSSSDTGRSNNSASVGVN